MNRFHQLISDPASDDDEAVALRHRLDAFYAGTSDYSAFGDEAGRPPEYYRSFQPIIDEALAHEEPRVLEVGAGRTRFPQSLGDDRKRVQFHAQDVTPQNLDYLREAADRVFIGDIASIPEDGYHLIFSTYVLEHITAPREFLEHVAARLAPCGWHVIICPRYDIPGYSPPSLRHLPRLHRTSIAARLAASRLAVLLGASPAFWVNPDPAVFHRPWTTDADAVHVASQFDIMRWHRIHRFRVRKIVLPCGKGRDWIAKRLLTIALAFQKPAG